MVKIKEKKAEEAKEAFSSVLQIGVSICIERERERSVMEFGSGSCLDLV